MFHEFEVILWSCFSSKKNLQELLKDIDPSQGTVNCKKVVLNHLINTAYYTKRQVTSDQEFEVYQVFFDKNF